VQFWQNDFPRKNKWRQRWAKTAAHDGARNSQFPVRTKQFPVPRTTGNRLQTVEIALGFAACADRNARQAIEIAGRIDAG
jgi:hypothetical protein